LEVVVAQDIGEALADRSPGDVAKVVVIRSGTELTLDVELTSDPDDPAQVRVGIQARTVNPEFPVDIDSENVGGPSAGMMYTLGIIDLLSPGDLTAGHVVAGTGTIAADGSVGGIGGIRQKVVAAEAAGAEVILVPESNYEEALTAPAGELEIVPVATVDDALAYLAGLE
jgi:PDZ domain-containing protein